MRTGGFDVAIVHPGLRNGAWIPVPPERYSIGHSRLGAEILLCWYRWRRPHFPTYSRSHWAVIPSRLH